MNIEEAKVVAKQFGVVKLMEDTPPDLVNCLRFAANEFVGEDDFLMTYVAHNEQEEFITKDFDAEKALGILLKHQVVCVEIYSDDTIGLFVNKAKVFSLSEETTSDDKFIPFDNISNLFSYWLRDRTWGPVIYLMETLGMQPRVGIKKDMQEAGVWKEEFDDYGVDHDSDQPGNPAFASVNWAKLEDYEEKPSNLRSLWELLKKRLFG